MEPRSNEPLYNEVFDITNDFLPPIIVKYMKKDLDITKPRYSEENLSVRRPFVTGKNNGFPFLDILGYFKNTHKNPKFGKVRQVPTREFPTKFPDWDLSHSSKFGIFMGIL